MTSQVPHELQLLITERLETKAKTKITRSDTDLGVWFYCTHTIYSFPIEGWIVPSMDYKGRALTRVQLSCLTCTVEELVTFNAKGRVISKQSSNRVKALKAYAATVAKVINDAIAEYYAGEE